MMYILFCLAILLGCGAESYKEETPQPAPQPGPQEPRQPGEADPWLDEIKPLVQTHCALSGCHAGQSFISTEAAIKASNSLARIKNGSMPPSFSPRIRQYNDQIKAKLVDFLD